MSDKKRKQIADKWAGELCQLDGKKAKVTGRLNRFATIGCLDSALQVEYAWEVVERVMSNDKSFQSM
jgi:hypothetical protein